MDLCLSGPYHLPSPSLSIKTCVILLHGRGSNGENMMDLATSWLPHFPTTAFFCPNAPFPYADQGINFPESYQWAPFEWQPFEAWDFSIIEENLQKALPFLQKFIYQVHTYTKVPFEKIILGGFSQGSMMAFIYGLYERPVVGGVLGYSGAIFGSRPLPPGPYPHLTLIQGSEDQVVPLAAHKKACTFLNQHHIPYEEFVLPHLEHSIDLNGVKIGYTFLKKVLG